jgi:immune inhibitor A
MRNLLLFCFLLLSIASFAVPAKKGVRQIITLADGTRVSVELKGDEHAHWWQSADGECYVADSTGTWKTVSKEDVMAGAKKRMAAKQWAGAKRRAMAKSREAKAADSEESIFKGQKRGLIILVNFSDTKFDTANYGATHALYDSIANSPGYSNHGFNGCISDYFKAQSGGQFLLNFDVAGPVTLSKSYTYYGKNVNGSDAHPDEMVREACLAVDSVVDFSNYDWDGDGVAEEVFVLYAGHGENDTRNASLIWPHMYSLSNYQAGALTLDKVTIDTYACTSELQADGSLAGIGTFCHEFSHCMGFPDMYDTTDGGQNYGMGDWDLMCSGSYNGDTYTPAGYSGYEKMVCGWTKPIELNADTTIIEMKPLADMGQTYIVYNKGNRNEYYILENRQRKGFDAALPGEGMLIAHIDYNEDIWAWNVVNATNGVYYVGDDTTTPYHNDHQRITVFHSGNEAADEDTAYPLSGNNSLTDTSVPAAEIWNANTDGSYLMHCAITSITQHSDSTMSFIFGSTGSQPVSNDSILFKETFDQCKGEGGNDGQFSGNIANAVFLPDNTGWKMASEIVGRYLYGADKCAKFGNSKKAGSGAVYSPILTFPGDTLTLMFRAAGWDGDGTNLKVSVEGTDAKILDDSNLAMQSGKWTSYTLRIVGTGSCRLLFAPSKRFFLDDVVITKKRSSPTTSIRKSVIALPWNKQAVYTIDGKYVGTDLNALPHGIYIVGGKKIVR